MDITPIDEFHWNLKRLIREGFPQGIPLKNMSSTYSHYLGKPVEPNSFLTGCDKWRRVFEENILLKKTFRVSKDEKVKIRGTNEESEEEIREVLHCINYATMNIVRFMSLIGDDEFPITVQDKETDTNDLNSMNDQQCIPTVSPPSSKDPVQDIEKGNHMTRTTRRGRRPPQKTPHSEKVGLPSTSKKRRTGENIANRPNEIAAISTNNLKRNSNHPEVASKYFGLKNKLLVYPRFEDQRKYLDGYIVELKKTTTLHEVTPGRKSSALVSFDDSIYDIGGQTMDANGVWKDSLTTDVFNKGHKNHAQTLSLIGWRRQFPACVCGDFIYAIGGYRVHQLTNSAERLDLSKGMASTLRWEPIAEMEIGRAKHGVAVLGSNIYVIGGVGASRLGWIKQQLECASVERFDTKENSWYSVKPMNEVRASFRTAVLDDQIYVVGGSVLSGSAVRQSLNAVEVYSAEVNTWERCATMNRTRSDGMVSVQDDLLYAIGGDSDGNPTVEVYDPRINNWMLLDWPPNLAKDVDLSTAIVVDI